MALRTNHPSDILRIRNHRLSGDSLPKAHQKGDQKVEPTGKKKKEEEDQPRASACCLPPQSRPRVSSSHIDPPEFS